MSAPQPVLASVRPAQNPLAAWREIDGVVVVISPEDSILHELNPTAGFIWKHATGERTTEEIARLLADEYEVDAVTALADTRDMLAELAAKKLLRLETPSAGEVSRG
ncbi:MAG: PqqD family protein [Acidobacteria bacterium]|nr:PqqD family protein [Acidobacteriota bacterium]MCL5289128.1 PqqD family protein [Acidobacteriota bacterium]